MKIIGLTAENIKRLVAVEIEPTGALVQITGKNGNGKQQPVSEPVLTPGGWKPIGDIQVGDYVIGSNGKPTAVVGIFPQDTRETYRLTATDGTQTRCGPDHLWTVHRWDDSNGSKVRITETLTTRQLMDIGLHRNGGKSRRWALPVVSPVEFTALKTELPIDPYVLGVIIGDGHIEPTGYVTVTSWDDTILRAVGPDDCWRGDREIGSGFWSRPLRHLGLAGKRSWEKFIPEIYQTASVEERFALFCGLMDTDGTAEVSWASFCTTSEALALDFVRLGRSLGFVCKARTPATKKYTYNGEPKEGRIAYVIKVKGAVPPFRLLRKIEAWSPSKQRSTWLRHIDSIERTHDEDSVCIQVAAADGLYVTNDFLVTHNTSVLDSIWWALEGAKHIQSAPIRKGQKTARIRLDLGEMVVTRTFERREDDNEITTKISVVNADGARIPSPQKALDALIGALTMDPLEFMRAKPEAQLKTLRSFAPEVDFDEIEAANKADYDKRTEVNRSAKALLAQAMAIKIPSGTPLKRIDETALVEELEKAGEHNADIERRKANRAQAESAIKSNRDAANGLVDRAAALRKEAKELEDRAKEIDAEADTLSERLRSADPLPDPIDTSDVRRKIEEAREVNQFVDARTKRGDLEKRVATLEQESEALTKAIEARKADMEQAVAAADMPIEGLGFGEDEVMLNGVPFSQASDAEQLRASMAIAMSLNPKLRVIRVRDGSLLDSDALKLVAEMAEAKDFQVWIERVDDTGKVGFVLEDGHVVSRPEPVREAAE